MLYEKDYDYTVENAILDDDTIKISDLSINNVDKIRFNDDPCA